MCIRDRGPTAEQAAKLAQATYKQFLEEPERSKQIANIPKLLKKFEGNYGTMVKGLQKKYGKVTKKSAAPEPEPEPEQEAEASEKDEQMRLLSHEVETLRLELRSKDVEIQQLKTSMVKAEEQCTTAIEEAAEAAQGLVVELKHAQPPPEPRHKGCAGSDNVRVHALGLGRRRVGAPLALKARAQFLVEPPLPRRLVAVVHVADRRNRLQQGTLQPRIASPGPLAALVLLLLLLASRPVAVLRPAGAPPAALAAAGRGLSLIHI